MRVARLFCVSAWGIFAPAALVCTAVAGEGAAPIAAVAAASAQSAGTKHVASVDSTATQRDAREPVQVAALGTPDLGLFRVMMLTEEEALQALEREVSLKVGKQVRKDDYPEEARRLRWTGTALVQVQVNGDGTVAGVSLERTSGFQVLDHQALVMVRRVSKLFLPFRLRGREHAVTVPIGFYLKKI